LRNSNDDERILAATTEYELIKECKLNAALPACKIKFDLTSLIEGQNVQAKIYKNGVAIGAEQTTDSASYVTKSENFTNFAKDDLIQIYAKSTSFRDCYIRNFRFYYDILQDISQIGDYPLEPFLPTTKGVGEISITNQDPA
ncbi:unnamed protein product, partial [marine sediment metagenome]